MGLTVKRLPGEQIRIEVRPDITPTELFDALQQGITLTLIEHRNGGARIRIDAPQSLAIFRPQDRLEDPDSAPGHDYSLCYE